MSRKRKTMARQRNILIGFGLALFLGTAVYFRLWSIDDESFTSDDKEILRRQFERANNEAMDETAEWRMKYDGEVGRSKQCQEELFKVKGALANANERLSVLLKENVSLRKRTETLTHKAEAKQQNCNCDLHQ